MVGLIGMVVSGLLSLALLLWLVGGVVVPVLRKMKNLEGVVCLKQRSFVVKFTRILALVLIMKSRRTKETENFENTEKAQEVS